MIDCADVLDLGQQIALALAAAHENGIVHRDLKPDNIMLIEDPETKRGRRVKILDFGLAKLLDDLGQATIRTNTGITMGTPSYMAPEQWRAERSIDHRADIYGLGCVLFHLLCGRPPFIPEGFALKMKAHLGKPPPDPSAMREGVPPDLASLLLTMLAKEPRDRYRTMVDVAAGLNAVERGVAVPLGGTRATTTELGPTAKRKDDGEVEEIVFEHSLHPSMPPAPSLPPIESTRLPVTMIIVVTVVVALAIAAWRLLQ